MFPVKCISSNFLLFVVIGYCCFLNSFVIQIYQHLLYFYLLFIALISESLKCSCIVVWLQIFIVIVTFNRYQGYYSFLLFVYLLDYYCLCFIMLYVRNVFVFSSCVCYCITSVFMFCNVMKLLDYCIVVSLLNGISVGIK